MWALPQAKILGGGHFLWSNRLEFSQLCGDKLCDLDTQRLTDCFWLQQVSHRPECTYSCGHKNCVTDAPGVTMTEVW